MALILSRLPSLVGWAVLAAVVSLFAGCATQRINWQARVGNYTYDEAVVELGPPEKSAKLSDGTVVADWLTQRSQIFLNANPDPFYPRPGVIGSGGASVTALTTPDYYLRLTFDPAGKLKVWKNFAR